MNRRQEQRALMLLQCVIFIVVIGALLYWLVSRRTNEEDGNAQQTYYGISDRTRGDGKPSSNNNESDYSKSASTLPSVSTFPFDPNTADAATLTQLGFTRFQVRNILKYRSKGGQYHRPEDLKRLYGMTVGQWERLAPYVRIGREYQYLSDQVGFEEEQHNQYGRKNESGYGKTVATPDSHQKQEIEAQSADAKAGDVSVSSVSTTYLGTQRVAKLHKGEHIDLAKADTIELQKVPGVGSYYARRIAEYGKKLGGFVSLNQLNDEALDFLPMGIEQWMTIGGTASVQKMHINKMTTRELASHPYITYYQAKQIVERVRLYGPFRSWKELLFLKDFSEKDKARLEPYVSFE